MIETAFTLAELAELFRVDIEPARNGHSANGASVATLVVGSAVRGKLASVAPHIENKCGSSDEPFDMDGYIRQFGLTTRDPHSYRGGQRWQMDCPFNPDHQAPDSALYVTADGAAAFRCSHNSCSGRDWYSLRDLLEPGWRQEKAQREQSWQEKIAAKGKAPSDPKGKEEKYSAAKWLVEQVQNRCELWKTPKGQEYLTREEDGIVTHIPVMSTAANLWLYGLHWQEQGIVAGPTAVKSAMSTLAYQARQGETHSIYVRKADFIDIDGCIYYDLGDKERRVVRASRDGWEVIPGRDCPARFRIAAGMQPMPVPVRGGSIGDLRDYLNVPPPEDDHSGVFPLILSWLLSAYGPHRPHPILMFASEQGSAKSTTARVLRNLIDPAEPELRKEPREERDLAIAATNCLALVYDNLSGVPVWLSDALCRVATGAGMGVRKLYSDDEEQLFQILRPTLITGIGEPSTRGDLLERALLVALPSLSSETRRTEAELMTSFGNAQAKILGALLDIVCVGILNLPDTHPKELPRMADFARWIMACEPACPWSLGTFDAVYREMQESATRTTLEGDAIATPLLAILEEDSGFWGTAQDLLARITQKTPIGQDRKLPKNARSLSISLTRIAPALRAQGWTIKNHPPSNGKRILQIVAVAQ